jgi:CBS domain-containing protein
MMNVGDVMTKRVVKVTPGHSVHHAAQIMLDNHVSALPVVDGDDRLVGILTEGDLLRRAEFGLANHRLRSKEGASPDSAARDFVRSHAWRVGEVMTSPVFFVSESTSLAEVAALFDARGIRCAPVLRDDRLIGIVNSVDLLRLIASAQPDTIAAGDGALKISAAARLQEVNSLFSVCPEITVVDGVVHLWGQVGSEAERQAARAAVESIGGFSGIEDHLSVALPA